MVRERVPHSVLHQLWERTQITISCWQNLVIISLILKFPDLVWLPVMALRNTH